MPSEHPPTFGLLLAIALPAVFTFGAGAIISQSTQTGVDSPLTVGELAALAERDASGAPLRPLAARVGSAALGPQELEGIQGGIRPAPPARIAVPAAGIDAEVGPVRARRGVLDIPDVGKAGWYSGGPRPGEFGRSVVIGHLDTRRGPGLFARVPSLRPGTLITITDARGGLHRYAVVGTAQVHKDRFPTEQVYGPSRAPVLVLVTCGGEWRGKERGGYRDNILLYARAIRGPVLAGPAPRLHSSLAPTAPQVRRQVGQGGPQLLALPLLLEPELGRELPQQLLPAPTHLLGVPPQNAGDLPVVHPAAKTQVE